MEDLTAHIAVSEMANTSVGIVVEDLISSVIDNSGIETIAAGQSPSLGRFLHPSIVYDFSNGSPIHLAASPCKSVGSKRSPGASSVSKFSEEDFFDAEETMQSRMETTSASLDNTPVADNLDQSHLKFVLDKFKACIPIELSAEMSGLSACESPIDEFECIASTLQRCMSECVEREGVASRENAELKELLKSATAEIEALRASLDAMKSESRATRTGVEHRVAALEAELVDSQTQKEVEKINSALQISSLQAEIKALKDNKMKLKFDLEMSDLNGAHLEDLQQNVKSRVDSLIKENDELSAVLAAFQKEELKAEAELIIIKQNNEANCICLEQKNAELQSAILELKEDIRLKDEIINEWKVTFGIKEECPSMVSALNQSHFQLNNSHSFTKNTPNKLINKDDLSLCMEVENGSFIAQRQNSTLNETQFSTSLIDRTDLETSCFDATKSFLDSTGIDNSNDNREWSAGEVFDTTVVDESTADVDVSMDVSMTVGELQATKTPLRFQHSAIAQLPRDEVSLTVDELLTAKTPINKNTPLFRSQFQTPKTPSITLNSDEISITVGEMQNPQTPIRRLSSKEVATSPLNLMQIPDSALVELQEKFDSLQKDLQLRCTENCELRTKIGVLNSEIKKKTDSIKRMNQTIEDTEENLQTLFGEKNAGDAKITELSSRLSSIQTEVQFSDHILKLLTDSLEGKGCVPDIGQLREEFGGAVVRFESLVGLCNGKNIHINTAQAEAIVLKGEIANLTSQLEHINSKVNEHKLEYKQSLDDISHLRVELTNMKTAFELNETSCRELQNSLLLKQSDVVTLTSALADSESRLNQFKQSSQSEQQELEARLKQMDQLSSEAGEGFGAETTALNFALKEGEAEIDILRQKVAEANMNCKNLQVQIDDGANSQLCLHLELQSSMELCQSKTDKISELTDLINESKGVILRLNTELEEANMAAAERVVTVNQSMITDENQTTVDSLLSEIDSFKLEIAILNEEKTSFQNMTADITRVFGTVDFEPVYIDLKTSHNDLRDNISLKEVELNKHLDMIKSLEVNNKGLISQVATKDQLCVVLQDEVHALNSQHKQAMVQLNEIVGKFVLLNTCYNTKFEQVSSGIQIVSQRLQKAEVNIKSKFGETVSNFQSSNAVKINSLLAKYAAEITAAEHERDVQAEALAIEIQGYKMKVNSLAVDLAQHKVTSERDQDELLKLHSELERTKAKLQSTGEELDSILTDLGNKRRQLEELQSKLKQANCDNENTNVLFANAAAENASLTSEMEAVASQLKLTAEELKEVKVAASDQREMWMIKELEYRSDMQKQDSLIGDLNSTSESQAAKIAKLESLLVESEDTLKMRMKFAMNQVTVREKELTKCRERVTVLEHELVDKPTWDADKQKMKKELEKCRNELSDERKHCEEALQNLELLRAKYLKLEKEFDYLSRQKDVYLGAMYIQQEKEKKRKESLGQSGFINQSLLGDATFTTDSASAFKNKPQHSIGATVAVVSESKPKVAESSLTPLMEKTRDYVRKKLERSAGEKQNEVAYKSSVSKRNQDSPVASSAMEKRMKSEVEIPSNTLLSVGITKQTPGLSSGNGSSGKSKLQRYSGGKSNVRKKISYTQSKIPSIFVNDSSRDNMSTLASEENMSTPATRPLLSITNSLSSNRTNSNNMFNFTKTLPHATPIAEEANEADKSQNVSITAPTNSTFRRAAGRNTGRQDSKEQCKVQ